MSEVRRVFKTHDNRYDALISLALGDRCVYLVITGLARPPKTVRLVELGGERVRLELVDQHDHGFLTCTLDRRYFEEEFVSVRCNPGSIWIISEETLARHRRCGEEGAPPGHHG